MNLKTIGKLLTTDYGTLTVSPPELKRNYLIKIEVTIDLNKKIFLY